MEQTPGAHALEYAGFWRRFAAFVIDFLILSIAFRILFPLGGLGLALTRRRRRPAPHSPAAVHARPRPGRQRDQLLQYQEYCHHPRGQCLADPRQDHLRAAAIIRLNEQLTSAHGPALLRRPAAHITPLA